MFRTWYANYHLLSYLNKLKGSINKHNTELKKKEINSLISSGTKYVSNKLNNTPTISKKSYINPKFIDLLKTDTRSFINSIPVAKSKMYMYLNNV